MHEGFLFFVTELQEHGGSASTGTLFFFFWNPGSNMRLALLPSSFLRGFGYLLSGALALFLCPPRENVAERSFLFFGEDGEKDELLDPFLFFFFPYCY